MSKKVINLNRVEEYVTLVVYMKRVLKEERLMDTVDPVIKEGASKLKQCRHWDFSQGRAWMSRGTTGVQ